MTRNKTPFFLLAGLFLLLTMQIQAAKPVLVQSLNKMGQVWIQYLTAPGATRRRCQLPFLPLLR